MFWRHCLLALFLLCQGSTVRAASMNKHDLWDAHHISDLPPEVRQYIAALCKGPAAAQQDFATYNPQEHRWRINIEYLNCPGLARSFRKGNQCLDVDFVEVGSRYRLARRSYAACSF
ncbi:hypothetical protein ACVW1C_007393 [Bradyrhizobium sp. USDA 4011]